MKSVDFSTSMSMCSYKLIDVVLQMYMLIGIKVINMHSFRRETIDIWTSSFPKTPQHLDVIFVL